MRTSLRSEVRWLLAPLAGVNLLTWVVALVTFRGDAVLLGAAFLAYGLGLRHAVDADHIAAIDNVTRKLIQTGRRPAATGLCFSLGHSLVVWLASLGVALTAANLAGPQMALVRQAGGVLGTCISALFLFGIAGANACVLLGIARAIRHHQGGEPVEAQDLERLLAPQGLYTRILRHVFRLVSESWHMLFVGFLFGLGFDTATEIGVLGVSAAAAGRGLAIWSILIFPALFTAGMSLVDTLDSMLMSGAYGWAFAEPARKLYYNLAVTFTSVVVALIVGGIEALNLVSEHAQLVPPMRNLFAQMSQSIDGLGYAIVATFAGLWIVAMTFHRRTLRATGIRNWPLLRKE